MAVDMFPGFETVFEKTAGKYWLSFIRLHEKNPGKPVDQKEESDENSKANSAYTFSFRNLLVY
jgi:hypothetical protein